MRRHVQDASRRTRSAISAAPRRSRARAAGTPRRPAVEELEPAVVDGAAGRRTRGRRLRQLLPRERRERAQQARVERRLLDCAQVPRHAQLRAVCLEVNVLDANVQRKARDQRRGRQDALALALDVRRVAARVPQPQGVEGKRRAVAEADFGFFSVGSLGGCDDVRRAEAAGTARGRDWRALGWGT